MFGQKCISKVSRVVAAAFAAYGVMLPFHQSAHAQWAVFDAISYVKNAMTAAEAVNATTQRATAYVNQLQQYQAMLANLKQLPDGALDMAISHLTQGQTELANNLGGISQLRDIRALSTQSSAVAGSVAEGKAAVTALTNLQQSMGGQQAAYSQRFEEARRMNMTWDQYAVQQDLQIRSKVAGAASRAQEDIYRNDRVKRDYEFAQDMAEKIPRAEGMQQSLAIMNTQMNRMVAQLAEVNKGLTALLNSKPPDEVLAEQQKRQMVLDNQRVRASNLRIQHDANQKALSDMRLP